MAFDIGTIAQGVGTEAASGILGMALGAYNDNRQDVQNRKLMQQQIGAQKEMTDYNMGKQLEMWKATSYPAQMEMLKKAGLNPGLIYGMGGGGGQTANIQPGHVDTAKAEQNPGDVTATMGMGIQAGMMQAQQRLMEAQAANLDADTANKKGVIPANITADTGLKLANTGNVQADTELKKIETQIAGVQAEVQKGTKEEQIMAITNGATKIMEEAMQLGVKTNIDRATMNTKIDQIRNELAGTIIHNALMNSEIAKNAEQMKQIENEIKQKWEAVHQGWSQLDINAQNSATQKFDTEMRSAYPSIWGVMGNALQTLTRIVDSRRPTYEVPTTPKH